MKEIQIKRLKYWVNCYVKQFGLATYIKHPLIRMINALSLSLVLFLPIQVQAATKEQAVKAGFIYNFSKFIVWPSNASADSNFNLCIIGDDKLDGSLEALYGKLVDDKPLVLKRNVQLDELQHCQMAFLAKDSKENMQVVLEKFRALPVVTVSDSPDFISKGGMIGLIRDGNRVGFEVDLTPVNVAGLRISAQLLKLAKRVKGLK
jgi:hypothetical protein